MPGIAWNLGFHVDPYPVHYIRCADVVDESFDGRPEDDIDGDIDADADSECEEDENDSRGSGWNRFANNFEVVLRMVRLQSMLKPGPYIMY